VAKSISGGGGSKVTLAAHSYSTTVPISGHLRLNEQRPLKIGDISRVGLHQLPLHTVYCAPVRMVATGTDSAVVERDKAIAAYEQERDAHTRTKGEVVELRRTLKEAERRTEVVERDLQLMALMCKQQGRDYETEGEHGGTHTDDQDLPNKLPDAPIQLPSKAAANLPSQMLNRTNSRFEDDIRRRLDALGDTSAPEPTQPRQSCASNKWSLDDMM
jgi:hypothetical protein